MVVLRAGFGDHLDARADAIAIRFDSAQSDVEPVAGIWAAVHPQLRVLIEAGGDDVDAAVAVEVAEGAAAMARCRGVGEACFRGERLPFAACPEIAKDDVGFSELVARRPDRGDLSARDEEVLPAVVVEVVKGRTEARHAHAERTHAAGRRGFSEVALAGVEIDGEGLALERDIDDIGVAVIVYVAKIRAHTGDECGIFSERDVGLERDFLKFVAEIVEEESVLGVIGHEEIGLAVKVVVGHPDAHTLADVIANAPLLGDIFERAVALVEKELVGESLVIAGMAVLRHTFDDALGNIRIGPLQIVHDEQIEQSVIVHVHPDGRNRPQRAILGIIPPVEAGFLRYVGECAVAVVVIERVAVDAGNEDVRMTIVVVISDGNADIEARAFETSLSP